MKTKLLLLTAAIVMAGCNSGGPTYLPSAQAERAIISVSATSTVKSAPDQASVTAGVVTEGRNAREAMQANATLMTDVYEQLDAAGIERRNITTSQLSLQPRYNYQDRRAPRIEGYEARNQVTVISDDLEKVGPMIDALVEAGINTINAVQFTVSEPDEARAEARDAAIGKAREKADAMARSAGVSLGSLIQISESGGNITFREPMMARMESDVANTPISAGEQSMSVTVNLTYAIEN